MNEIVQYALDASYLILMLSFFITMIRLLLGKTLPDRVSALDLMSFLTIAFVGIYTIDTGQKAFLDIAIILALVVFLSTVAFARFIIKRAGEVEGEIEADAEEMKSRRHKK